MIRDLCGDEVGFGLKLQLAHFGQKRERNAIQGRGVEGEKEQETRTKVVR